jgi:hypothetical protein
MSADALIFREPVPAARSADDWDVIVDHLVSTLATAIGMPLIVDDRAVVDSQVLSCRVMTTEPVGGPLRLGLTITIGLEIIEAKPFVDAAVFAFSGEVRLAVDHYAVFRYHDGGRWNFEGWVKDVYGEFHGWPPPRARS